MAWVYGDILDRLPAILPDDKPALIHGKRVIDWGEFTARSNNLARALQFAGLQPGDRVAFYLRNGIEYPEMLAACFKGRFCHVNLNYRYGIEELHQILADSDAVCIVYAIEFVDHVAELRDRLPELKLLVESGTSPTALVWAHSYEQLAELDDGAPLDIDRSPDDKLFIYTGGTTGLPKGVVWTVNNFMAGTLAATRLLRPDTPNDMDDHLASVAAGGGGGISIPACPMMHGTAFSSIIGTMMGGGTIVALQGSSFDAEELLAAVQTHEVQRLTIVGDAFAKPILDALDAGDTRWDISSLEMITSSGTMWSREVKLGLLRHAPQLVLADAFGASEGLALGMSVMTAEQESTTAHFAIGVDCKVFAEDGSEVQAGDGRTGMIALAGPLPERYHKDQAKSDLTFKVINGVRYAMPGDWCQVAEDGSLILLGRGNNCINTAGEKVYPEEVEEVLKAHPAIQDALVIGVADDKWGQAVTAVLVLEAQASAPGDDDLRRHVRAALAGYKVPKKFFYATGSLRVANGKANYEAARQYATQD